MRIHLIAGFMALVSQNAVAQDLTRQQQIDQAKSVLQMACLSGTSYEFNATADGKIELKSLSPGGRGGINVNVKRHPEELVMYKKKSGRVWMKESGNVWSHTSIEFSIS